MSYLLHSLGSILKVGSLIPLCLFILLYPVQFGVLTFFLSMSLLWKLAYEKAVHDREFYSSQPPQGITSLRIRVFAGTDVVLQSIIFSLLAVFLFSGTSTERKLAIIFIFILTVFIGSWLLRAYEKSSHINIERWGYVKISVVFGIIFSILLSTVDGTGWWHIIQSVSKSQVTSLSPDEVVETVYGLLSKIDGLLKQILTQVFGNPIGTVLSLLFTTNTTFGFVIYIYAILYVRLQNNYESFVDRVFDPVSKFTKNSSSSA